VGGINADASCLPEVLFWVMTIQTVSNSAKDPGVTELGHRLVADEELAP